MRQLKEQIDMLLKESADRKSVRLQNSGSSQVIIIYNDIILHWRLTADGWRLTADGWRLTADGWRLTTDDWRLTTDGWRLTTDADTLLLQVPGGMKKDRISPAPTSRPVTPASGAMDTPKGRGRGRGTPSGQFSKILSVGGNKVGK